MACVETRGAGAGLSDMNIRIWIYTLLTLTQLQAHVVAQGLAYTWVDKDGITHFSDSPPATGTTASGDIVSMPLPQSYTAPDPAQDYYSISNQWRRMQEVKAEQDGLALQREQLRIEWYRAEQQAREAEAASAARIAADRSPLIIVQEPYPVHRPGPYDQRPVKHYPAQHDHTYRPGFSLSFGYNQPSNRQWNETRHPHDSTPGYHPARVQGGVGPVKSKPAPDDTMLNRNGLGAR